MKACMVTEYYPRAADPVLGMWAHLQAIATRDAGAEVEVLVLYRPVPPLQALRADVAGAARAAARALAQPLRVELDGLQVTYVPFVSPPRPSSYGTWGRWAAAPLAVALRMLRRRFPFDVIHAHNAVPAGEAVRRTGLRTPTLVSVHGGDVFYTALGSRAGADAVRATLEQARLVLANSAGVEQRCRMLGARATRVVRLGTDLPSVVPVGTGPQTVVTIAHLVARKRHAEVLRALWILRDRYPDLHYLVIGDGPERGALQRLAGDLGLESRIEFAGQLPHAQALARMRAATIFAMPSSDEAFGVVYVEAMAGGLPVIAALGEPGPAEIQAAGDGIVLVPPGDVQALAAQIDALLGNDGLLKETGAAARATVKHAFSWEQCGAATVAAYEDVLRT